MLDSSRVLLGLALGVLETAAPRRVARAEGLGTAPRSLRLVRIAGAHKLASAALLASGRPSAAYRTALAGAAFDGWALAARGAKPDAFARLAALAAFDAWRLARL